MRQLKHRLAVWLCWSVLISLTCGQALPEQGQKVPQFGIQDDHGFFNRDSGAFKRISDQLGKLARDHGYKIYLVVEPVLIASSPAEIAADLRRTWLPESNGLVVVFESDTRRLEIGRDLLGTPVETENSNRVPSHETSAILSHAMEAVDPKLAPEAYVEGLMAKLVEGFDAYFTRRTTPPPAERSVKIGLLIAGTLALLGLAAIGLGGFVKHSSMAPVSSFRFPLVDRPERLGAPCGSSVTARRFARQEQKPS